MVDQEKARTSGNSQASGGGRGYLAGTEEDDLDGPTASGSDQRRNASAGDGWTAQMPAGCLLAGVADVEHTGFVPHAADDRRAHRQACFGEAAGDREQG